MNESTKQGGTVLLIGASGLLGRQLAAQLRARMAGRHKHLHLWTSSDLDLRKEDEIRERISQVRPTVVLNAAAYANVDGCETDTERAFAVNGAGPGFLAAACRGVGALLCHFSTDFVFNGAATRPYLPTDPTDPLSVYGQSKWDGEVAIRRSGCEHLILRTSWLFGPGGKNFVDTILERALGGGPLRVVTDQVGRPTYAPDLADATLRILDAGARGTYHFCNTGSCSWHEFAVEIVRAAGLACAVQKTTSKEFARPAKRPAYSVLDTTDHEALTSHRPRHWSKSLADYIADRSRTLQALTVDPSDLAELPARS